MRTLHLSLIVGLKVIVYLQQHSGKVSMGYEDTGIDVVPLKPLDELVDRQLVDCPNLSGAIVGHHQGLPANVRITVSGLKLVGESEHIFHTEGAGTDEGEEGLRAEAGAVSQHILLNQR